MRIARIRKDWPRLYPPEKKAGLTVIDLLQEVSDEERDALIGVWMKDGWRSWAGCHDWVRETTDRLLLPSRKKSCECVKFRC